MFMGLALGNYIGVWSFYKYNIMVSAISITLFPLLGFIIVCIVRSVHYHPDVISPSIVYGIRKIWRAGTGFALANIGYASITTFLVLLFIDNDWGDIVLLVYLFWYWVCYFPLNNRDGRPIM